MMNNIILNGVNSNTIQGLIIQELPPISKPAIRTEIEEIDGRDGDVITKLGYAAYDKQLSIGLYGNYDINQVISFFDTSGTVIFSNEPDKYYNYQILNEIDFERLVRFRTAIVTMHVQPFKYSATETPQELSGTVITGEGTNINLVNTTDSGLFTDLQKRGDTFQQTYSGKNKLGLVDGTYTNSGVTATVENGTITLTGTNSSTSSKLIEIPIISTLENSTEYIFNSGATSGMGSSTIQIRYYLGDSSTQTTVGNDEVTRTTTASGNTFTVQIRIAGSYNTNGKVLYPMIRLSSVTDNTYEPYVGGVPSPNPDYPQEIKTVTGNCSVVISNEDSSESQTYPISLGNIELCEINGTQDYIYKNNGTWYLHKEIGKRVLNGSENWQINQEKTYVYQFLFNHFASDLNLDGCEIKSNYFKYQSGNPTDTTNEDYTWVYKKAVVIDIRKTIASSLANFKTWLSTHNTDVYYLLATPTDTEITDSTLLSQLNALGNATTYADQTNISTSGEKLSPILYVETVAVDDPTLKITNSGNTTAKPIMTLYGTEVINLSLNGEQIFVIDLSSENYITIDVANMEAYYNGILKNRLVTGNYENFVLNQGENEITFTGTLYSLTISNYSRWI